jgi:hypothetical protein
MNESNTFIPNLSPHQPPGETGDTGQMTMQEWAKFCAEEARKQSSPPKKKS